MPNKPLLPRREFLKTNSLALAGLSLLPGLSNPLSFIEKNNTSMQASTPNLIGAYGTWAASLHVDKIPKLSFRKEQYKDIESWRPHARAKVLECMAVPDMGEMP